jgi:hypothetical protein
MQRTAGSLEVRSKNYEGRKRSDAVVSPAPLILFSLDGNDWINLELKMKAVAKDVGV